MVYLLHHLLDRAASTASDQIAVLDCTREITYEDLDTQSNQLAQLLTSLGVSRGDRVGLYLEKSIESIVGIYGILKAGAAYVPLDPQAPTSRLAYILRNCGIRVLLTGREKASAWAQLTEQATDLAALILLNGQREDLSEPALPLFDSAALANQPVRAPHMSASSQDLAYILYTSGSTGDPKGVMITHGNSLAFVRWATEEFSVGPADRLSGHAPLHFDLSIFDIFAAAAGCATLVLVPSRISIFPTEIARFIERNGITVWYSVPSVLTRLIEQANLEEGALPSLRLILFAGEIFPTRFLRRLMNRLPHVRFANLYGPTETNVCTWYGVPRLPADQIAPIPIGKAIANVEVFAVTDEGRLAQPGEVGELYARGPTVMQGYWADRELTGRSLIADTFHGAPHDAVYKTGDLVREREDGNFEYLGRRDAQIKSRGYRIELGEIEAALYANPAVVECAVLAVPDEIISNRIIAYVAVREGTAEVDLVRACAERLPRYMIPEAFVPCDVLPKTSTGKIDRHLLAHELELRKPSEKALLVHKGEQ